ncbi:membrane protein [Nitrococcus mobilis]|uniref:membrane protein n=1 Tax=Nitrococcus mobilis TaxID=35797 RepID=UPI000324B39D|nr:membrane protein [Nitrococcus mobilis]
MRRLYFLLPNVETTRSVVHELLLNHVEERHIHVVAREGVPLEDLPKATEWQKSDLIPAAEKGLTAGGLTGALAGLVAVTVPPAGLVIGGGAVLALTVAGAGFGAWVSGMIGIGMANSRLEKFQKAVDAGEVLMMVDVAKRRVDEIEQLIRNHHDDVDIEGVEPNIPNFP